MIGKIRRPNKFTESQAKLWESWIICSSVVHFCESELGGCLFADLIVEIRILVFH